MTVSFQLYSSRFVPSQDAFLATLAGLGYGAVEGFPGVYSDASGFRGAMDRAGITMPTGHFPLEMVRDEPQTVKQIVKTLGIRMIFVPAVSERVRDADGWRGLGQELAAAGETFWEEGYTFGWHNHNFEFADLGGEEKPIDLILGGDDRLAWEFDVAWAVKAGEDPAAWLAKYRDRIAAIHVKDIAPEGAKADEDGWADVGEGTIDWAALKAQIAELTPDAQLVMEHDKPSDAERFARTSIAGFKGL